MQLSPVSLGELKVSRLILGGNPISGFSHQSSQTDREMVRYFTSVHIKDLFAQAEKLGIQTVIARADRHIMRVLAEYWDEGGTIRWIAQTCPELGPALTGAKTAADGGASAVYIHGGQMDYLYAQNKLDEACTALDWIKSQGLPAGVAAHNHQVHLWANDAIDNLDFHMCSYFNPSNRDQNAAHQVGTVEVFDLADREQMVNTIAELRRPVIHYKIFAAGRIPPAEAFTFAVRHLRPTDAICVGIYPREKPDMLKEDLELLQKSLEE